ncbi:MAG TPA: hypothetical protein QGF58_29375 [Myxococcota bacterium]|nr:hypothetical protein [Myxococcota bacterium]
MLGLVLGVASGTTLQAAYEDAYDNVEDGDWLRDYNDDNGPYVANQQAYVLRSLATMFRATEDVVYLDRLAYHVDGLLEQRNDRRGVTDYRDEESPCWRETWYSNGGWYCWTLHSGVTIEGQLQFAVLVREAGLEGTLAYDGVPFGDKADAYVIAAEETVAFHNRDWDPAGWYILAEDTRPFLGAEAGTVLPMNMSNAMGIPLLLLYDLTGDEAYLEQATALAARFYDSLSLMTWGGYAWTYYLDDALDYGEDLGHASLSVRFAVACWQRGLLFDDTDMERLARVVEAVTIDDRTFWHALNGRELTNYLDYQASLYEWLPLRGFDPAVYTTVRNLYELSYPTAELTSAGQLDAWAHLAESELPECGATLVDRDWDDEGTALTERPRLELWSAEDCMVPLVVDAESEVRITSSDMEIAVWQATGGPLLRFLPATAGQRTFVLEHSGALRVLEPEPSDQPPDTGGPPVPTAPEGRPCPEDTGCGSASGVGSAAWILAGVLLVSRRRRGLAAGALLLCLSCTPPDEECLEPAYETANDTEPDTEAPTDSEPVEDPLLATQLSAGSAHTCALRVDETVECWGSNASGQLDAPEGTFVQIEAGLHHTCGVTTGGEVQCWGWSAPTDLSLPEGAFSEAAGAYIHSAAIGTDGAVQVWGTDESEQIYRDEPQGSGFHDLSCGKLHCGVIDQAGRNRTWGGPYYTLGDQTGVVFTDLDAGYYGTCGVTDAGSLHCWGLDTHGQLSPPDSGTYTQVSCGSTHCCALDVDGSALCFGANHAGQSDAPTTAFVEISAGDQHTCGRRSSGEVECWGNNAQGQCDPGT